MVSGFEYDSWSACDADCDGGKMERDRHCIDGYGDEKDPEKDCGSSITTMRLDCNTQPCPGTVY